MSKAEFAQQIQKSVLPPKLNSWSPSNIKEYVSALLYLKMATSIGRSKLFLTSRGKDLAIEGSFGTPKLNEKEKESFRRLLFGNERFLSFLTLFTGGKAVHDYEDFVASGGPIMLKYGELRTNLDRREVQDIFKSWALSTEIIEWNSSTNEYFPVKRKDIPFDDFLMSVLNVYKEVEDQTVNRAEIYKIKDRICSRYKIPSAQFYENLLEASNKYPERFHLELASIMMMPIQKFKIEMAEKFGIVTSRGIYYYLKIVNGEEKT